MAQKGKSKRPKQLRFGEGLLEPTLYGEKRFIVRRYRPEGHAFVAGEIVEGVFNLRNGTMNVLLQITRDTKVARFDHLKKNKREQKSAGYHFDDQYFEKLTGHYADLSWDDMGAVIFYEVLEVRGIPVVSLHQYTEPF